MAMIDVIASPGVEVPFHDDPKSYITDAKTVRVPDNAYYRRCLAAGDLQRPPVEAKAKAKTKGGNDGE